MKEFEKIALFDMDGTLCDYANALISALNSLKSPMEPEITEVPYDNAPKYLQKRTYLITSSIEWWQNLPKLQLGFEILSYIERYGYTIMILSQGPKRNANAWTGKKKWIDENLGQDVNITLTRDKGLVYGKILVDDWPDYIIRWLKWRPRGLVVMPANSLNKDFKHPQVIRYDGSEESKEKLHNKLEKIEEEMAL